MASHKKTKDRRNFQPHTLCWSVDPSVCPFVTLWKFLLKGHLNRIKAPAHRYTTDAVVYMALFINWCVRRSIAWTICLLVFL